MFRTPLVIAGLFWLGCIAGLFAYQKYTANEPPSAPLLPPLTSLSQKRQGVRKDIWTVRGGKRLHTQLLAARSEVIIQGRKDVIETLHDITCWVQENVNLDEQELRYFAAPSGTYTFGNHHFVSDEVQIAFYRLPGITLPKSLPHTPPVLSGIAKQVILTAGRDAPMLTAHHLRARVEQWP